jgi:hypothetical protein
MKLSEIKDAVKSGKTVCWKTNSYRIVYTQRIEQWLIVCGFNGSATGLTWADGETLNGSENEFYIVN